MPGAVYVARFERVASPEKENWRVGRFSRLMCGERDPKVGGVEFAILLHTAPRFRSEQKDGVYVTHGYAAWRVRDARVCMPDVSCCC